MLIFIISVYAAVVRLGCSTTLGMFLIVFEIELLEDAHIYLISGWIILESEP